MSIRRCTKKGFTLIELLVVVTIITLLVAILLPSLSKAREQSKSIQCLTNLKMLGSAFSVYLSECNGIYPKAGNAGNGTIGPQWYRTILQDPALPGSYINGSGYASNFDGKWKPLFCPNDYRNAGRNDIAFGNISYGYNAAGFAGIDNHSVMWWVWGGSSTNKTPVAEKVPHLMAPVKVTAVQNPALVILLLDYGIGTFTPASSTRGWYRAYPYNDSGNGLAVPRHMSGTGGNCNVLYGDGHADPVFVASGRVTDLYLAGKLGDPWAGNPPRNRWWWMP